MILYFSGTGNSMAISCQLAERLGEQVMPLNLAVKRDLSQERRIGLVFPCYWFNAPRAVTELVPVCRLNQWQKVDRLGKPSAVVISFIVNAPTVVKD